MSGAPPMKELRSKSMAQYLPGLTMPAGRHLSHLATTEDDREIENAYIEVRRDLSVPVIAVQQHPFQDHQLILALSRMCMAPLAGWSLLMVMLRNADGMSELE